MKVGIGVKFKNSPASPRPFREVYEETIEYIRVADTLGFDHVTVAEHHCIDVGYNPTPFLTLTALARETKRIGLCSQPLLLPLYNPVSVAEQLAVLDVLSNGRAMLGVGAGYREADFTALGVPYGERGVRMTESLEILLRALRERNFDYKGKFYDLRGVDIVPRPIQKPHPKVFVTAASRPAVERAVKFGLPINTHPKEAISDGLYAHYCKRTLAAGLDPRGVDVTLVRTGFIANDVEKAIQMSKPLFAANIQHIRHMVVEHSRNNPSVATASIDDLASGKVAAGMGIVMGSPQTWRQAVQSDLDAVRGPVPVEAYNFALWPEGMPLNEALEALELFAREVAPGIKRTGPSAAPSGSVREEPT